MATMARGLAEALRGFQEGRAQRQMWDYQRERDRRAEEQARLAAERQARLDEQNRAMMEAQIAQMQDAARRANEQLALQQTKARQELQTEGYRPDGSPVEGFLRGMGQDIAQLPTETIGGVRMRRVARPDAQMAEDRARLDLVGRANAEARERDQLVAQLPAPVRARAAGLPLATVRGLVQQVLGRELLPREATPVNLQVVDTDQGKMLLDPRSGATRPMRAPDGQPVRAPQGRADATEERKFQAAELATQQIVPMLQEYKRMIQTTGPQLMAGDDPAVNAMTSLGRQIQLAYKGPDFAQLGVLAGPDMEILEDVVSSPTGARAWWRGKEAIAAQIDQVLNNIERGRRLRHQLSGREKEYQPLVPTGDRKAELRALKTPGR